MQQNNSPEVLFEFAGEDLQPLMLTDGSGTPYGPGWLEKAEQLPGVATAIMRRREQALPWLRHWRD